MTNDTEDFDYGESLSKEGSGFGVSGAESLPDRQTNEKPTTDPVWGSSNVDSYAEDDLGSGPEPQPQEEYIDAEFEDASDDQDGYLGGRLSRRQALIGAAGAGILSLGGAGALLAGSSEEDEEVEGVEADAYLTREEAYSALEPLVGDCTPDTLPTGEILAEAEVNYAEHTTDLGSDEISELGPNEGNDDGKYWLGLSLVNAPVNSDKDLAAVLRGTESTYTAGYDEIDAMVDEETMNDFMDDTGAEVAIVSYEQSCE